MPPSTEALQAVRDAIPPDMLAALLDAEIKARNADAQGERKQRRQRDKAIAMGQGQRIQRPVASIEDRRLVPGALKHFRKVHGLTQRQACARIGYSARANTWAHWESGLYSPPYNILLRIIASAGMAPVDSALLGTDPNLRLEIAAAGRQ